MTYEEVRQIYAAATEYGLCRNVSEFSRMGGLSSTGVSRMLNRQKGHVTSYSERQLEALAKKLGITSNQKKTASDSYDWTAFRRETAQKALLNAIHVEDGVYPDPDEICGMAVLYADRLIELLREEKSDGSQV